MPVVPSISINFSRGYHPDGGPFFNQPGFVKGGINALHKITGEIGNRPGIELVNELYVKSIDDQSSSTYTFVPSTYYGEFLKDNGYIIQGIFLRTGSIIRIYLNDTDPTPLFNTTLTNIDIRSPDQTFFLTDVSNEAIYNRTYWGQEGNTVIVSNRSAPIIKLIWNGTDFSQYRVEAEEYNERIYTLPKATTLGKTIPGWFSRELPLKTGTTDYKVLSFIDDIVPGYEITIFKIDSNEVVTKIDASDFTYSESIDSEINLVTCSLDYASATTGEYLRIYFGRTLITDFSSELELERVVISDRAKDFGEGSNSYNPKQVTFFAGRVWLFGLDGPIDNGLKDTFSAYGTKYKKIWVSEIFPSTLSKAEVTKLKCRPRRGPFDIDDNLISPDDGGIIELDDAGRLLDGAAYGTSLFVVASNGVWRISGQDEVFNLASIIVDPVLSHEFAGKEPLVKTEEGIFIFGDSEIFWINPRDKTNPVKMLAENRISSIYNSLSTNTKATAFVRYEEYNKRVYYFYNDDATYQEKSKYNEHIGANKYLCYDIPTRSWLVPGDYSEGEWYIEDIITVPQNNYFSSDDFRFTKHSKVTLVTLSKKQGNFTELTFGILEGKPYCSDYYGTTYVSPFNSNIETYNSYGEQLGTIGGKKGVARATFFMVRQELDDADSDGYYEYPGAVYMSRRWDYADNLNAGPLYDFGLDSGQTAWVENKQLIYFPSGYGKTGLGGTKPGKETLSHSTKVRGRGSVIGFKFGNDFGNSELTGTIEEQEKGWGIYGYELLFKGYK